MARSLQVSPSRIWSSLSAHVPSDLGVGTASQLLLVLRFYLSCGLPVPCLPVCKRSWMKRILGSPRVQVPCTSCGDSDWAGVRITIFGLDWFPYSFRGFTCYSSLFSSPCPQIIHATSVSLTLTLSYFSPSTSTPSTMSVTRLSWLQVSGNDGLSPLKL